MHLFYKNITSLGNESQIDVQPVSNSYVNNIKVRVACGIAQFAAVNQIYGF